MNGAGPAQRPSPPVRELCEWGLLSVLVRWGPLTFLILSLPPLSHPLPNGDVTPPAGRPVRVRDGAGPVQRPSHSVNGLYEWGLLSVLVRCPSVRGLQGRFVRSGGWVLGWLSDGVWPAQRAPFNQSAGCIERSLPSALLQWDDALVNGAGPAQRPSQSVRELCEWGLLSVHILSLPLSLPLLNGDVTPSIPSKTFRQTILSKPSTIDHTEQLSKSSVGSQEQSIT